MNPHRHLCFALLAATLTTTAAAAPVNWVATSGGTWENAANWSSTPFLPTAADDVTVNITGSHLITLNSVQSVNALTMSEDFNLVSGALTVGSGGFLLNGVGGEMTIFSDATFTLAHNDFNGATNASSNVIHANGLNALADFSSVTTITGNTFASANVTFRASAGGLIDASGATAVDGGAVRFIADGSTGGTPSTIDLSSLTSFDGGNNNASRIEATNGARILMPATPTNLDFVALRLDATSTLDVTKIASYTGNGHATIDGSATFSALTNANGGGFIAQNGGLIALPLVTDYNGFTGAVVTDLKATGSGSRLDMSSVATLTGNTFASTHLRVTAEAGGAVDLRQLTVIDGGKTQFTATGAGSAIDLSSLTSFTHTGNVRSFLKADTGGTIDLPPTADTVLTNVDVVLDPAGTIEGQRVTLVTVANLSASADLTGSGTLGSALHNLSGLVSPGINSAGSVTIGGDFAQGSAGELALEIFTASSFDTLTVNGSASLAGTFTLTLAPEFDLLPGMEFKLIDINISSAGAFEGFPQAAPVATDNGHTLYIDYFGGTGNDVVLTTTQPVPEPAAATLLLACGTLMLRRRRPAPVN